MPASAGAWFVLADKGMTMRFAFLVAPMLFAVACGGGSRATTVDTTSHVLGAPTAASTEASVSDATALFAESLLTLSGMPTGWTTAVPKGSSGSNSQICGTTSTGVVGPEKASATFQKSTTGPFLAEELARYPGNDLQDLLAT